MADERVQLIAGGMSYEGWESISVVRNMETLCGSFELKVTERWPGHQAVFAINPGDTCRLLIGGETVITGYVDDRDPEYDEKSHFVMIRGRDAAGDLVDCSTIVGAASLPSGPAINLIAQICKPFGIRVSSDVAEAQTYIEDGGVQVSETAFEAISRIAEQSGFLVVSDGQGGIRLTNTGTAGGRGSVILGENILRARGKNSMKNRFSEYIVAAQVTAGDTTDVTTATAGQGKAADSSVPRYRPLIIMADLSNGLTYLQQRAVWEGVVRLGRAWRADITVRGWRDAAGLLWAPNTLAHVKDEWLAIDAELLISGVRFTLDDDGELAQLTVTYKQAFQPTPIPLIPNLQSAGGI